MGNTAKARGSFYLPRGAYKTKRQTKPTNEKIKEYWSNDTGGNTMSPKKMYQKTRI
jgi:hypothetical protein